MGGRRHARASVPRRLLRLGDGRLRGQKRRRPRPRAAGGPAGVARRRAPRDPRDHPASRPAETVLLALVRPGRPAARPAAAGWGGLRLSAGLGPALSPRRRAGERDARRRVRRRSLPPARWLDRRLARRGGRAMSPLAAVDATPGLAAYMAELE